MSTQNVLGEKGVAHVQLRGVVKSFGARLILDQLDLDVTTTARLGIVGANGSGKSTLLRIIAGDEHVDTGSLTIRRGLVTALLPQHVAGDERTCLSTVLASRPDIGELEEALEAVAGELAAVGEDLDRMSRALARQEQLLERWTAANASSVAGRARAILRQLGLDEDDHSRPTRVLSGGKRKLVALGACLLREPDILLMDEPEAHLDLAARERVEQLMRDFSGGVILVSHDRYLLDEVAMEIGELEHGRLRLWPGNYSSFAVAKELEAVRLKQLYVTQQKEIARLEDAVRRFKDWAHRVPDERHIKQARVKQQQIDRMVKIDRPMLERRKIRLEFYPHARGGERVLELKGVGAILNNIEVLTDVNLTVFRGERIGVVGANGSGKSVLIRILAGKLAPTGGERRAPASTRIGYLSQDGRARATAGTPIDFVRASAPISESEAVRRLMQFLFDYEQVRRPLETLSGGEWTRLELLRLMLSGANCLLLDEPTNHLDIAAVEVLERALDNFAGTALFASHDRYFLEQMAGRIVEVSRGDVRSYEGSWEAWRTRRSHTPRSRGGRP